MELSQERVRFHFDRHDPIEIQELSNALSAIGKQYDRVLDQKYSKEDEIPYEHCSLYVPKIVTNCILVEIASQIIGACNDASSVITVFQTGKMIYESLTQMAKGQFKPISFEETSDSKQGFYRKNSSDNEIAILKELKDIAIVALGERREGNLKIQFDHEKDGKQTESSTLTITHEKLDHADRNIEKRIRELERERLRNDDNSYHKNVYMFVDREWISLGLIEELSSTPHPIYWKNREDWYTFFELHRNRRVWAYVVDVKVIRNEYGEIDAYDVASIREILFKTPR